MRRLQRILHFIVRPTDWEVANPGGQDKTIWFEMRQVIPQETDWAAPVVWVTFYNHKKGIVDFCDLDALPSEHLRLKNEKH